MYSPQMVCLDKEFFNEKFKFYNIKGHAWIFGEMNNAKEVYLFTLLWYT